MSDMSSKLVPSDPSKVLVIRQVTPNITTCSAPFFRFGRFKVGGRGTIGKSTLHSSLRLFQADTPTQSASNPVP